MVKAGISLCMIVRNEERFLDAALRSVEGCVDELCIVDTGSTDGTIEIARAHGARVLEVAWHDDFAAARNAALALATRRWIFVLDADERLHADSRQALRAVGAEPSRGRGKWLTCRNLTEEYGAAGSMSNALVRIFPNHPRIRYRNAIHEFVALDGSDRGLAAETTTIEIVHHGYLPAIMSERRKGERNLRLARAAALREPADAFHHYNLGMASLLTGDRAAALAALERMRELTRTTPRGYRVHGLVVLAELHADERGDLTSALVCVREALGHVPNYSNALFLLGQLLARSGDPYAARNAFGGAIAAGAHDDEQFVVDGEIAIWKAHSEIGATLMVERRFAEALAWFELAAAARPTVVPLLLNRAKCREALGDLAAADDLFAAACAGAPAVTAHLERINFLLRAGALDAALAAIDTALAIVDEREGRILLATAAAASLRRGDVARARAAVARILASGDRASALETLAALARHWALPELVELARPRGSLRAEFGPSAYLIER